MAITLGPMAEWRLYKIAHHADPMIVKAHTSSRQNE